VYSSTVIRRFITALPAGNSSPDLTGFHAFRTQASLPSSRTFAFIERCQMVRWNSTEGAASDPCRLQQIVCHGVYPCQTLKMLDLSLRISSAGVWIAAENRVKFPGRRRGPACSPAGAWGSLPAAMPARRPRRFNPSDAPLRRPCLPPWLRPARHRVFGSSWTSAGGRETRGMDLHASVEESRPCRY